MKKNKGFQTTLQDLIDFEDKFYSISQDKKTPTEEAESAEEFDDEN